MAVEWSSVVVMIAVLAKIVELERGYAVMEWEVLQLTLRASMSDDTVSSSQMRGIV